MESQSGDEVDVIHAFFGKGLEDCFDDALTDVGSGHGREGQGDVVEGDGDLHPRPDGFRQGVLAQGVFQGVTYSSIGVFDGGEGGWGVDDSGPDRQLLISEGLAVVHEKPLPGLLHPFDQTALIYFQSNTFMSGILGASVTSLTQREKEKATLAPPRFPARPAVTMASL